MSQATSDDSSRSSQIYWDLTVPLLNLTTPFATTLTNGFELSPFTSEEQIILLTWGQSVPMWDELLTPPLFKRASAKLNKSFMLKPAQSPETDEMRADVGRVLTALRLYKSGDVGAWSEFTRASDSNTFAGGYFDEYRVRRGGTAYNFLDSDVTSTIQLINMLQSGAEQQLAIALRRFNQAYSRELHEDRIIDLSIALEGSLLANVEDELTYRLALRGAALLSGIMHPLKTKTFLEAMYFVRSKIVHEGWNLFDHGKQNPLLKRIKRLQQADLFPDMHLYEFSQYCENIVRDILKVYIARIHAGKSLIEVNSDLDNQIIVGIVA